MRLSAVLILLLPSVSFAQTEEMIKEAVDKAIEKKLEDDRTAQWVFAQESPDGGFRMTPQDKPSLRATLSAMRALKYHGFPLLKKQQERHAAFIMTCFDPKTGAFADVGGKPDVPTTSLGIMAAIELGVPKEKVAKGMDYLKENAKTFEEVRIAAAAVEVWGVKDCPFDVKPWDQIATKYFQGLDLQLTPESLRSGEAREGASVTAFAMRLGLHEPEKSDKPEKPKDSIPGHYARMGQRDDGGWGKKGEKASDIESTYRVMRAFYMLKEKPRDVKKLREFISSHRNADGGYATTPGGKSSVQGAYFAAIITKWLDELEKK